MSRRACFRSSHVDQRAGAVFRDPGAGRAGRHRRRPVRPAVVRGGRGIDAYAIGTISCNIGDTPLLWQANNPNHPVIGQNVFRLANGRFEHIGQAWLKHGFTALTGNLCSTCQNPGTGSLLGVGCSDPYSGGLNGSQGNLGPKSEVNAYTGAFTYPYVLQPTGNATTRARLQCLSTDVDPATNAGGDCITWRGITSRLTTRRPETR